MNIELLIQNKKDGLLYDVSEAIKESIQFEEQLDLSPGKLTFTLRSDTTKVISEGSTVSFKVNAQEIFFGYVFKFEVNHKKEICITAYNLIRYLKFKDTYNFEGMSCQDIFKKICGDKSLKHQVVHECAYVLPARLNDNKTLADMLQYTFDKTLIDTKQWMFYRDDFGTLKLLDVAQERTNLILGDGSLVKEFSYGSSIDEETYNQIKLRKENKETGKRDTYIVKDDSTIKMWGLLQYHENVDENMNDAQIEQLADKYLESYNKPKRTLKIPCVGDMRVRAGKGVLLMIGDLKEFAIYNTWAIVSKVSHSFGNDSHMMDVEVWL